MFVPLTISPRGATRLLRLSGASFGKSLPRAAVGRQTVGTFLVPLHRQFSDMIKSPKPMEERTGEEKIISRIKSAYKYVGGGLAITAASATALYNLGLPVLMADAGAGLTVGVSLATTITLLCGTIFTDYDLNPQKKKAYWTGFLVANSAMLSVLGSVSPTILLQAGAATGLMMGGLSIGGIYTNPSTLTPYRAPLGAALGVVAAASVGQIFWPLPILHTASLYGRRHAGTDPGGQRHGGPLRPHQRQPEHLPRHAEHIRACSGDH